MSSASEIQAQFEFANSLIAAQSWEAAKHEFQVLAEHLPEEPIIYASLAYIAEMTQQWEAAEAAYLTALSFAPMAEIYLNLGVLYLNQARLTEAQQALQTALELDSALAVAWINLGIVQQYLRHPDATATLQQACHFNPASDNARFNLGYHYLQTGQWAEGWPLIESRTWYQYFANYFQFPKLQRKQDLKDKRLLLTLEAGHGDLIQFVRFIPQLLERGAKRVDILCHSALKRLFESTFPDSTIYTVDQPVPNRGWDFWLPALSCGDFSSLTMTSVANFQPYVHGLAPIVPRDEYSAIPRIGVVWRGNPDFENDQHRSFHDLALLNPLLRLSQQIVVPLQHDITEVEKQFFASTCIGPVNFPSIHDFADVVEIVQTLDLVISIDSAVAHLAGAMGKPCWLLLPAFKTDWRWMLDRQDTPWYPTMRLFRQKEIGNWEEPVAEVSRALHEQFTLK